MPRPPLAPPARVIAAGAPSRVKAAAKKEGEKKKAPYQFRPLEEIGRVKEGKKDVGKGKGTGGYWSYAPAQVGDYGRRKRELPSLPLCFELKFDDTRADMFA